MISSCRSTAERRRASAAKSSKLFPLVKSANRSQAVTISNNHALGSRGIQQLARRLDALAKIGVPNSADFDEIDAPPQQRFRLR